MPVGWDPQRPPGMFPWLDLIEGRIPAYLYALFSVVGLIIGFFLGLTQDFVPLALCAALGMLFGLLFVPLLLKSIGLLLCLVLIALAALGTFWMMNTEAAQKHNATVPSTVHASPAATGRKVLDALFSEVR